MITSINPNSLQIVSTPAFVPQQSLMQMLVAQVATSRFQLLTKIAFFGYGMKIFLCDGAQIPAVSNGTLCQRVYQWSVLYFNALQSQIKEWKFNIIYGSLFMASGVAGTIAVLQNFDFVYLGPTVKLFEGLEIGLFLTGCIYALINNIHAYNMADDMSQGNSEDRKKSAILGIISNLNYLFWGALFLYGATTASILFCLIGLATGGSKIVYDYYKVIAQS